MSNYGLGFLLRSEGKDIERQSWNLQTLLQHKGFKLRQPVIIENGDGVAFLSMLRLIQVPDTADPVFVLDMRHLHGRADLVRLYVPVCLLDPFHWLKQTPVPGLVVSGR